MKRLLLFTLSIVLIVSCQKNTNSVHSDSYYLKNVEKSLSDSLSKNDFARLDLGHAIIINPDSTTSYLRIPFLGIPLSKEFVVLKTNTNGIVFEGFIIDLKKDAAQSERSYDYNGSIKMSFLNREEKLHSSIINGYITAFTSPEPAQRSSVVPGPRPEVLPNVVVTSYISTGADAGGPTYSDWLSITGLFESNYGTSAMYSPINGQYSNNSYSNSTYGANDGGGGSSMGVAEDNPF